MTQDHKPHITLPNGDRIYQGGYGRTRDGRKVGPMVANRGNEYWPWIDSSGDPKKKTGKAWDKQGKGCDAVPQAVFNPDLDLIAEWTDEPEAAPIDNASPLRRHAEAERPAPDYNDGNWHGWNGRECPDSIHPASVVEFVWHCLSAEKAGLSRNEARAIMWAQVIRFRVVKPYTAPREWWIVGDCEAYASEADALEACKALYGNPAPVHVREVKE